MVLEALDSPAPVHKTQVSHRQIVIEIHQTQPQSQPQIQAPEMSAEVVQVQEGRIAQDWNNDESPVQQRPAPQQPNGVRRPWFNFNCLGRRNSEQEEVEMDEWGALRVATPQRQGLFQRIRAWLGGWRRGQVETQHEE